MPNANLWGWDTPNTAWVKVLVDSLGHLQVDVLSSELPDGAATEATLADIESAVDGIEGALGQCYGWIGDVWYHLLVESAAHPNLRTRLYDGTNPIVSVGVATSVADSLRGLFTQAGIRGRDGAFWRAINAEDNPLDALLQDRVSLSTISKLYGFNGTAWSRLRTESDALFNLRVKLFDGANGIDSDTLAATPTTSGRGIHALAQVFGKSGTSAYAIGATNLAADNLVTGLIGLFTHSFLFGYDGTNWDRLRTYGTGILKVGRAPIGAPVADVHAVGLVVAGAAHIFWISCTPESTGSEWEISDDLDGSTDEVMCHFDSDKHSEVLHFDPPQEFTTGIYVKKFDKVKCLHICYGT